MRNLNEVLPGEIHGVNKIVLRGMAVKISSVYLQLQGPIKGDILDINTRK